MIKWAGTTLCLIGIALTAYNIYPANLWFSLVGSFLWMYSGLIQKDIPLFLVEGVAVVLYLTGVIKLFI